MNAFRILQNAGQINEPKVGQILKYRKILVEVVLVISKGFQYVDGPEIYELKVRKV